MQIRATWAAAAAFLTVIGIGATASAQRRGRAGAGAATAPAGGTSTGGAAASGSTPATGTPAPEETPQVRNEGGRRVYVSQRAIEVRGEIQRPFAFLLSGRGSLGYSYFDQPIHFIQEILNAVRHPPF